MYTKTEWLKQVLTQCCRFSEMEDNEKEEVFANLEKAYDTFLPDEKESIHNILKSELEQKDFVYVYSILVKYFNAKEFGEKVIDSILQNDYNWYTGSMLELQVIREIENCYEKKRLLHKKNVDTYNHVLGGINYKPIPLEKRNPKRIVLIIEHILSILHAPTQVVLNFASVLQENLGYEVLILACPCDGSLPEGTWAQWRPLNARDEFQRMPMLMEYHNVILHGYQVNMSAVNIKEYCMMFELIYAWNPCFVFSMGVVNPIADLAGKFTTLVSMAMSINCPVSEGQILIRLGMKDEETEAEYGKVTTERGQTQLFFTEEKLPVSIEKSKSVYSREESGLPEDRFLIAVVGNRLDEEVDLEFAQVMKHIMEDHEEAAFVIIGKTEKVKEYFLEEQYQNRIFYLGYCQDLMGIYGMMDFYMNPKRRGGGFSSQMALAAGIPVMTLPNCDVAYHVGEKFTVEDYPAMEKKIGTCIEDKSYYEELKRLAGIQGASDTEEKMVQYVKGMLDRIKQCMDLQNGTTQREREEHNE